MDACPGGCWPPLAGRRPKAGRPGTDLFAPFAAAGLSDRGEDRDPSTCCAPAHWPGALWRSAVMIATARRQFPQRQPGLSAHCPGEPVTRTTSEKRRDGSCTTSSRPALSHHAVNAGGIIRHRRHRHPDRTGCGAGWQRQPQTGDGPLVLLGACAVVTHRVSCPCWAHHQNSRQPPAQNFPSSPHGLNDHPHTPR